MLTFEMQSLNLEISVLRIVCMSVLSAVQTV